MNFELTPEQQTLQQGAIEFARRELNIDMIERDAQQVFSHDGWKNARSSKCRACRSQKSTAAAAPIRLQP
jgi:hypothetical protein